MARVSKNHHEHSRRAHAQFLRRDRGKARRHGPAHREWMLLPSCRSEQRQVMDVRDGFIVSIYNYCDSWCETCAFTSRCRVFADVAETEAALDPQLQAIVNAPLPPPDDPPPPGWMTELIEEMNAASVAPDPARLEPRRTPVPVAHLALRERSRAYCEQVHGWLRTRDYFSINAPDDPRAVVGWFHTLIPAKIARAVVGLAEDGPVHDEIGRASCRER